MFMGNKSPGCAKKTMPFGEAGDDPLIDFDPPSLTKLVQKTWTASIARVCHDGSQGGMVMIRKMVEVHKQNSYTICSL